MANIEIRNRFTGNIIISGEYESIKHCLERNRANLQEANLRGADLQEADLRGADLQEADLWGADLRGADLRRAYLRRANLWEADLRGAELQGANLRGANLRGADLRGADLWGADLRGADLWGAKYQEPLFLTDSYSLKLLPEDTVLTFWKYLIDGKSPYYYYPYEVGQTYTFENFDNNENNSCGLGGNVATLMWCLKDNLKADEFIEVCFKVSDIVAIPFTSDGKFRVKQFTVLRKINRKEAVKLLNDLVKGGK